MYIILNKEKSIFKSYFDSAWDYWGEILDKSPLQEEQKWVTQKQSEKSIVKEKCEWINSLSNSNLYHKDIAWCQEWVDASLLDISFIFRRGNTEF